MTDSTESATTPKQGTPAAKLGTPAAKQAPPRWAVIILIIGTLITFASGSSLLLINRTSPPPDASVIPATLTPARPQPTATGVDQALIPRQIIQPPTLEVQPSPTAPAATTNAESTSAPVAATRTPTTLPATQQAQPTFEGTPIAFTNEEKNALSWMCYYEVGGMGSTKYDACLSVISTVRARFTLSSGFGTDVMSVLTRPNQFNIPIVTDRPHDTFISTVDQYANGARGSCNAYFYFDSVPGGPSLCIIYGFESFIEFHSGWN